MFFFPPVPYFRSKWDKDPAEKLAELLNEISKKMDEADVSAFSFFNKDKFLTEIKKYNRKCLEKDEKMFKNHKELLQALLIDGKFLKHKQWPVHQYIYLSIGGDLLNQDQKPYVAGLCNPNEWQEYIEPLEYKLEFEIPSHTCTFPSEVTNAFLKLEGKRVSLHIKEIVWVSVDVSTILKWLLFHLSLKDLVVGHIER